MIKNTSKKLFLILRVISLLLSVFHVGRILAAEPTFKLSNAVIDSNTYYYIVDESDKLYSASIKVNKEKLPFVKNGDKIMMNLLTGEIIK